MAKTKETAPAKSQPSHGVFVIENDGPTAYWTKIGCAWAHGDGQGFNVQLAAIPVGGRIVIRARKEGEQENAPYKRTPHPPSPELGVTCSPEMSSL